MEHSVISFTTPVPLQQREMLRNTVSHRPSQISTLTCAKTVMKSCVGLRDTTSSPFFEVLPDGLPPEKRPLPPPKHWRIPIIGVLVDYYTGKSPTVLAKKYGPIYKSSLVSGPMTFITNMCAITDMLKNPRLFTNKGSSKILANVFGEDSMLLLEGREHAAVRNKVTPAFATAVFPFLFDKIRSRASKTWATLEKTVSEKGKQKADPALRRNYLSLIVEITTGIDMDSDMAPYLVDRFFTLSKAFFSPPFGPFWEKAATARDEIKTVIEHRINKYLLEKKGTIEKLRGYADKLSFKSAKDIKKGDVNVMLVAIASSDLKAGPGVENDPKEIASLADLILLLWFAGYATSSATTSCAVFEMGMDKSIWELLYAEQKVLVREAGDKEVSYEQGGFRILTQDASVLGKYVKGGDRVFLDFSSAMRDPRMYPDPDTLKVDRFVRKEGEPPPPKVISFGAPGSAHFCLGAGIAKIMMRTTLAVLLREYTMVLDPKQSREYAFIPDLTPKSKVIVQNISKRI